MMNYKKQNEEDYSKLVKDIAQAKKTNSLFCFIGAGTSISQGFPNWNEYVNGLIDYWTYHLEDIVSESKTKINKVKTGDRNYLQWLKKANYSKERKVDLVHEVISEYCQCDSSIDSTNILNKYIHQYEQSVFIDSEPMLKENKILNELVNLRPIFITTNYDKQIEQADKNILQLAPKTYSSINEYHGEELVSDEIIHLHGMPKSLEPFFVSSSQSYLKMYNDDNKNKELIKKLFSTKENPLLIFIGSSLQEDSVLHFLDFQNIRTKKYAIMLFQSEGIELDNVRSQKLKDYYSKRQHIQLVWYGSSFEQLPSFLHELNLKVDREIQNQVLVTEKELKERISNGNETITYILKALDNQEYTIVDKCLKDINDYQLINNLLQQKEFLSILKKNPNQFLQFIKSVINSFDNLTINSQKNIFNSLDTKEPFNLEISNLFIQISLKYWEKFSDENKASFLNRHISRRLNPEFYIKIEDNTVQCLYLISFFQYPNAYPVKLNNKQIFNFDKETYKLLNYELRKLDKQGKYYESWKVMNKYLPVSVLFNLFKTGKIRYNKRKDFPVSFYKNKTIQKILVNVDLDGVNLTEAVKEKLFKKIDWNFKYVGKEFNLINKKYKLYPAKSSQYYVDGILESKAHFITPLPFFEIKSKEYIQNPELLLSKLRHCITQKRKENWNNFTEVSLSGQNNEVREKLIKVNLWYKFPNFYKSFIEGLFKDKEMYEAYNNVLEGLLELGLKHNLPNIDEIVHSYIQFLEKNMKLAFNYPNSWVLWKDIIKCKKVEKTKIYKFIINKIRLKDLTLSFVQREYFEINDYLQNDFFNYCYTLLNIEYENTGFLKKYMPKLIKQINMCDPNKREMFKGMFFNFISERDLGKCSELSLYFFANFNTQITIKAYKIYKNIIELLLKRQIRDTHTINFIMATILCYVEPKEKIKELVIQSPFKSQMYNYFYQLYWDSTDQPKYTSNWLNYLISNDKIFVGQTISKIIEYIRDEKNDQISKMLRILKASNQVKSYKLTDKDFMVITFVDEATTDQLVNLVELIKILCQKNYLIDMNIVDIFLEEILNKLYEYMLNGEIDELISSISDFIRSDKIKEWSTKYKN